MSEGSVMKLVKHLTDMQAQFFEHSQLQTKLITEMLSHLGRAQQTSVRQDLARIEEIGRELNDIKTQLSQAPGEGSSGQDVRESGRQSARPLIEAPSAVAAQEPPPHAPHTRAEEHAEPLRASSAAPVEERIAGAAAKQPPQPWAGIPAGTTSHRGTSDAHAWLSQRMANLAQERTSRWRHILNVFNRKPAGPPEE
jgi:hypothetical protein